MDLTSSTPTSTTRRTVVAMAGASGLAVALAACGGSDSGTSSSAPSSGGGGSSTGGSGSGGKSSSGGKGTPLAKTSEIPEGGGKIFAAQKVVVTQPTAGKFKCFSAICTHQGCTVAQVKDGTIDCPCHGSKFHIADGSVANGPAPKPLAAESITVANGEVTLG